MVNNGMNIWNKSRQVFWHNCVLFYMKNIWCKMNGRGGGGVKMSWTLSN